LGIKPVEKWAMPLMLVSPIGEGFAPLSGTHFPDGLWSLADAVVIEIVATLPTVNL
jgi:hypothetical protein